MRLLELAAEDISTGFYDPAEDKAKTQHLTDVRKPVLRLKHLNKLKRMRALKKLENLKRQDLLGVMYGEPVGGGPDDMGMGGGGMGGGLGGL